MCTTTRKRGRTSEVQQGYSLLPEFLKLNKDNYEAGLKQMDFKGATEASRQTINLWVEQRTENKIRELLPPGILDSYTRLVRRYCSAT